MRKKELKLVVTFHTTADAMAMEKACKENNTPVSYTHLDVYKRQSWKSRITTKKSKIV